MYSHAFGTNENSYLDPQAKPGKHPLVRVKFCADSSWAQAAYAEFREHSPAGKKSARIRQPRQLVTCSVSDTIRTLRSCGGLGGNLVANLIELLRARMEAWEVDWTGDTVAVRGFLNDRVFIRARAYFDRLPFGKSCPHHIRPVYNIPVSISHSSDVHGATPELALDAVTLVTIAAFRLLPSVDCAVSSDQPMALPVGPNELATILHSEFATKPTAVAEAVLALNANAQDAQKWLLNTLEQNPKVAILAAEVGKYLVARDDVPPSLRKHALALIHPEPNHGSSD